MKELLLLVGCFGIAFALVDLPSVPPLWTGLFLVLAVIVNAIEGRRP